jgi:hypothetical protein
MSPSEQSFSSVDDVFGRSGIRRPSIEHERQSADDNGSDQAEDSVTSLPAPGFQVVSATELIDSVADADNLFQVAKMAFVDAPVYYQFEVRDPRPVNLNDIKADVDGWKVSFVAKRNQGFFNFIRVSQDPEVIVFRRPKPIPRMLWKDSSQAGTHIRDLSGLAGVRIGRLNR